MQLSSTSKWLWMAFCVLLAISVFGWTKVRSEEKAGAKLDNSLFGAASDKNGKASFPPASKTSSTAAGNQCFCKLEGRIDDCLCSVDTVDYFNNWKIFPRLQSLIQKPFFRYFKYRAQKPCPFWDRNEGKCASSSCGVKQCQTEELPPGIKAEKDLAEEMARADAEALYTAENIKGQVEKYEEDCEDTKDEEQQFGKIDGRISEKVLKDIEEWTDHDRRLSDFCDVDEDFCPDCDYVDLALNPEKFTGYSGEAARRVWRAIYEENCFSPKKAKTSQEKSSFSAAFMPDTLEDMCLEKRAFFRAISGLHTSITVHLCSNYLLKKASASPFGGPLSSELWGPNLGEFQRRFDPETTNGQGPYWLKNLYFVYLLELRALAKAAPYLESQMFYTGSDEDDADTRIAVKEILNLVKSFPDQFDESSMFAPNRPETLQLKREFTEHFHNISRIMDCVGCDKCKLWGKLQITGLGTALKILFSEPNKTREYWAKKAEDLQRLSPPSVNKDENFDIQLNRNEIVSLFNAFARISTSIRQLEKFRDMSSGKDHDGKSKDEL